MSQQNSVTVSVSGFLVTTLSCRTYASARDKHLCSDCVSGLTPLSLVTLFHMSCIIFYEVSKEKESYKVAPRDLYCFQCTHCINNNPVVCMVERPC